MDTVATVDSSGGSSEDAFHWKLAVPLKLAAGVKVKAPVRASMLTEPPVAVPTWVKVTLEPSGSAPSSTPLTTVSSSAVKD